MLIKGILTILFFWFSAMPFGFTGNAKQAATANDQSLVYVQNITYTPGDNFARLAKITFKNSSKHVITKISFQLNGNGKKGCNQSYNIERKIKLQPHHLLTISQPLKKGDCETHTVQNIKIAYTINVNFTLD